MRNSTLRGPSQGPAGAREARGRRPRPMHENQVRPETYAYPRDVLERNIVVEILAPPGGCAPCGLLGVRRRSSAATRPATTPRPAAGRAPPPGPRARAAAPPPPPPSPPP